MTSPDTSTPDVFVSYARANRALAEQLADGLAVGGLRVWWDRNLVAGSEFASVIEAQLLGAAVVVVLWSADSVHSSFVRDESSRTRRPTGNCQTFATADPHPSPAQSAAASTRCWFNGKPAPGFWSGTALFGFRYPKGDRLCRAVRVKPGKSRRSVGLARF